MSRWTHVAGIIRVDSIFDLLGGIPTMYALKDAILDPPSGSEGPVRVEPLMTREPGSNTVNWGQVLVWGDLRDYDDVEALVYWFTQSCQRMFDRKLMIRDALLRIRVEYARSLIVTVEHSETDPMQVAHKLYWEETEVPS